MKLRAEYIEEDNGDLCLNVWLGQRCVLSATIDGEFYPEVHREIGQKLENAINNFDEEIG